MSDPDDFEPQDQDVPAVDIPDLKKKEKERKKAGAAWGSGRPAGSFTGATGGQGAAARAAASAARSAAGAAESAAGAAGAAAQAGAGAQLGLFSQLMAQFGTSFAALTSTLLGKALVLAAASLLLGGAAAVAYRMLAGGGGGPAGAGSDLGGISSTLKVHREGGSAGLEYAAGMGRGQLQWEKTDKGGADQAGKAKAGAEGEAAQPDQGQDKAAGGQAAGASRDRMEHSLSGAKLSGAAGGGFGAHNIFSGGAPTFGSKVGKGFAGGLSKFNAPAARTAKGGALAKRSSLGSSRMQLRGIKSNRALAQLRGMSPLNARIREGGGQASEANSAAAMTQFEGTQTQGGAPPGSPALGSVPDAGPGMGVGDVSSGLGTPGGQDTPSIDNCDVNAGEYMGPDHKCTKMDIAGTNVTPWQGLVDTAWKLLQMASMLLVLACALYWLGMATLCSGGGVLVSISYAIAAVAGLLAGMVIALGHQVNSMGGSPQGSILMTAGAVTLAGAVAFMFGGAMIALILGAIVGLSSFVSKALTPPQQDMPPQQEISCPSGTEAKPTGNALQPYQCVAVEQASPSATDAPVGAGPGGTAPAIGGGR